MENKVALITGANSGIGLALASRLLDADPGLVLCLCCRNTQRAEAARQTLLAGRSASQVHLIPIDVSSMKSVYRAVAEIKDRYSHIDYLYLNAGILPVSKVDWNLFFKTVFSSNVIEMFRTGRGLLVQHNGMTADGYKEIFATNVFGHFVLVKELGDVLGGAGGETQIIWTASQNAHQEFFTASDIQDVNGGQPYSASKYLILLVSSQLNATLNHKNVFSYVTCPGVVVTNLMYKILPSWFWLIVMPLQLFLRFFMSSMTISPENGSEALFWLSKQKAAKLSTTSLYCSSVSIRGTRYTKTQPISIDPDMARSSYNQLNKMADESRTTFLER